MQLLVAVLLFTSAAGGSVDPDRVDDSAPSSGVFITTSVELSDDERALRVLLDDAARAVDIDAVNGPFAEAPRAFEVRLVREDGDGLTQPGEPLVWDVAALNAATASQRIAEPRAAVVDRLKRLLEGQLRRALVDARVPDGADSRGRLLRHLFREGLAAERSLGLLWAPGSPEVGVAREQMLEELSGHLKRPDEVSLSDDPLRGPPGWDRVPVGLHLRGLADFRDFVARGPAAVEDMVSLPEANIESELASQAASSPSTQPASAPATQPLPTRPEAAPTASMDLAHYAKWYGPEWILDAALLTLLLADVYDLVPAAGPAIGPSFDPAAPASIFDPRLDGLIGRPYVQEQISEGAAAAGIIIAIAAVGAVDAAKHREVHRAHNFFLGATTALASTATVTWGLKLGVGRLRPDFRERYLRAACAGEISSPNNLDCSAVDDGFVLSAEDVEEGRRSFPSGHSSLSFAAATYLALHVGSTWVWGDGVPDHGGWRTASQVGGVVGATVLISAASYVAASRVTDNRHHPDDVMLGAAIGTGLGAASYLLHFELDGTPRRRGLKVSPTFGDGPGVALSGEF